jgi:enoyl-CoA hydratase/carnithine racemase
VSEELFYEKSEHVGVLTLNRPDVLNALTLSLLESLRTVLDAVNADPDVHVVVLTGAGDRAFSVGFDLSADGDGGPSRTDAFRAEVTSNFETFMRIWNLRVPTIAAVNGYALAAGSNLALCCDITLASDRATFGEPEVRHYALSPLVLMPWFGGNRKMMHYLYYSGDTITAQTALELGMIARVVPHPQLLDEAMTMARRIASVAPYAVQAMKDSVRQGYDLMGFTNAMRYHLLNDLSVMSAVGIPEKDELDELMSRGDMKAFLDRRDGPFR